MKNFLSLSYIERKDLLKQTLALARFLLGAARISDSQSSLGWRLLQNRDIKVAFALLFYDAGSFYLISPYTIIGHAGYMNGDFVYSENYYLKLKVDKDGIPQMQANVEHKVVVEKDPDAYSDILNPGKNQTPYGSR